MFDSPTKRSLTENTFAQRQAWSPVRGDVDEETANKLSVRRALPPWLKRPFSPHLPTDADAISFACPLVPTLVVEPDRVRMVCPSP